MDQAHPAAAPVLSTPETRLFEDQQPEKIDRPRLDDEQIHTQYEIERTVAEIRAGSWKRIALQFPDPMLVDAPRVFRFLSRGLKAARRKPAPLHHTVDRGNQRNGATTEAAEASEATKSQDEKPETPEKLFILADTSYGACCVDEVAAEHADADVVVHYGRSCLSPTARLPVIYVFTKPPLDLDHAQRSFEQTYPDKSEKILIMADIPFQQYLEPFAQQLKNRGYTSLFTTSIVHDTASPLPNRTLPLSVKAGDEELSTFSLFHVSNPPSALLLTVSSAVRSIHIYDTSGAPHSPTTAPLDPSTTPPPAIPTTTTTSLLRRRYALLTRLTTAPIIGILINTLSVHSYMTMLTHLKRLISSAGKKSYTFVVGKVNAAKIANFAEVGGWVVVGCWESSLFDSGEFWRPVVTPWELECALRGDERRVWGGRGEGERWRSDFGGVLGGAHHEGSEPERSAGDGVGESGVEHAKGHNTTATTTADDHGQPNGYGSTVLDESPSTGPHTEPSDDESAPPEFDLRTGRYVSHSRPMAPAPENIFNPGSLPDRSISSQSNGNTSTQAIAQRRKGDLATINNAISPAADFFREKRSWQGLGSDWGSVEHDDEGRVVEKEAARVELGRRGLARGYVVGDGEGRT